MSRLLSSCVIALSIVSLASVALAADSKPSPRSDAPAASQVFVQEASLPSGITSDCGGLTCAQVDLDGSGTITPSDFSPWLKQFFSGIYLAAYDYNNDGVLTLTDFSLLICEYWVCH